MTEPSAEVLRTIRSRRVARALTAQPVTRDQLDTVLEAASFAPSAGNRRLHPLVVVTDPGRLSVLRLVSPGMLNVPPAIVICNDQDAPALSGPRTPGLYVDGHRSDNPAGRARDRLGPDRLLSFSCAIQRT
jgi:nitroreductase